MSINIKELQELLKKAAQKYIPVEEAEYFADQQIDTHLKKFPRVNPLEDAVEDLENLQKIGLSALQESHDHGASWLMDFNGTSVSPKIKYIHDQLELRAKKYGLALVAIKNSYGIHDLNLWTDGLSKRNLLGICMYNGGPNGVVPYAGTHGFFGTNPLSYSIPTNEKSIIVDMASSEIPYFEVKNSKKAGKKLKPNVAVDSNGNPTTDPSLAMDQFGDSNLLPLGGNYKGYALSLLIEILTGSLVGSLLSNEMTPAYVNKEHGGFILAFDIGAFNSPEKFKESVTKMSEAVRKQKPAVWADKVTVPGDRTHEKAEKILRSGEVEIDEELLNKLKRLV